MANPANDIFRQAHQGSVAAIIQVLNDKLSDSGVRTRAIFASGVLQLLCEAPTAEQLDPTYLTDRIRKTLESISPKNIRRVNINSRIVREQQLLWLEEIHRDPDGQVLWSKEISLNRKNIFRRSAEEWREAFSRKDDFRKPLSAQAAREKRQFAKGVFGGLGISAAVVAAGWGLHALQSGQGLEMAQSQLVITAQKLVSSSPPPSAPVDRGAQPSNLAQDPFAIAVRLAQRAAESGRNAQTPQQKQAVASLWGQASELMASVPGSDTRKAIAENRTVLYQKYKDSTLERLK
ncbi:hypothetical protein GS601_12180 [Myxacorys almedinensis A]|uniref:Uncharacterized protein n=1 Tax=Myxacorys almedinensis A TaxID=2690445 RepID=A0A8J8CJY2_9CYAN|nr:hypothetical protein [Myxacorys almedinensis A]